MTQNTVIRIAVTGGSGKMGRALVEKIVMCDLDFAKFQLVGAFNRSNSIKELKKLFSASDIIIDYSSPSLLKNLLDNAISYKTKLIIGTTGLNAEHIELLNHAAKYIPVLYSANMSLGANLISILAAKAAGVLINDYDIAINETHHKAKIDAPSGTALMIGKAISQAAQTLNQKIDYSSIRVGGGCGEHRIIFANNNEIVTIKHQALNRESYVDGTLLAAKWIMDKPKGLYSMIDVFDTKII